MNTLLDRLRTASAWLQRLALLIVMTAMIAGAAIAIVLVPRWQIERLRNAEAQQTQRNTHPASPSAPTIPEPKKTDEAHLFELENEARKTITQIAISVFGLLVLYMTWRRTVAADKTTRIAEETSRIAAQGHITDRYSKAIEQLGASDDKGPNIEIRLGGIYALERIALDSDRDFETITEVFTAYIRRNARWIEPKEGAEPPPPIVPERTDLQAILTILGKQRMADIRAAKGIELDLSESDMREVSFARAVLTNANLNSSRLEHARLRGAHLEETSLIEAHLEGADLFVAHLEGANLGGAHMEGANFGRAHLEGAFLFEVHLEGTFLVGAQLTGVTFATVEQIKAAQFWQDAHYDPEFRAKLGLPPVASNDEATTPPTTS